MNQQEIEQLFKEGKTVEEVHKLHGATVNCDICVEEYQNKILEQMGYLKLSKS